MISIGGIIAVLTLFGLAVDMPEKVDPLLHTEAEAMEEHAAMDEVMLMAEQTQAGFNAYALSELLEQEIEIIKLQIKAEQDEEEKEALREELKQKQEFRRKLKEEERKQLLKGKEDA